MTSTSEIQWVVQMVVARFLKNNSYRVITTMFIIYGAKIISD
jgi:hypothetical protein